MDASMSKKLNPTEDETDKLAQTRTHDLMQEFRAHSNKFTANHPEHTDKGHLVFESWAIQKIAGLQLSVEYIAQQLNNHNHKTKKS
jgi:hypothetical protein